MPKEWKVVPLSRIADIGPGINKALSEMGKGTLYVTVEDLYHGSFLGIGRLGRIRISKSEVERFSLQVGDLVLGKSSVKRDGIGYPNLFLGSTEPVVPSGFTYRVRPDMSVLNSKFLLQYLRSGPGRKWIIDNSQSSALTNINSSIVERYPVMLPPLKEQVSIAEALSDADSSIEALERLIAKKRDMKLGAMQELLTGRTRLPGFTEHWQEVRLGDHASMRSGGTPLSSVAAFYGGSIPWASISDMSNTGKYLKTTERSITEAGLASSSAVVYAERVLLYAMYASIGECCISTRAMASSQAILGIKCASTLNVEFLYYIMQMKRAESMRMGQQGTQSNLNAEMVRNTIFATPSSQEQEAIAAVLGAMDEEIEALEIQLRKMKMVKEGMMQDLLTGKVRLV